MPLPAPVTMLAFPFSLSAMAVPPPSVLVASLALPLRRAASLD
jgi:hypothetical protein